MQLFWPLIRPAVIIAMAVLLIGCGPLLRDTDTQQTMDPESPADGDSASAAPADADGVRQFDTYLRKKQDRVEIFVGYQVLTASWDEEPTPYIPLIVGVRNRRPRAVTFDLENIRLYDRYGEELPQVSLEEIRSSYTRLARDQRLLEFTTFGGEFDRGRRVVKTNFYPPPGRMAIPRTQVHQAARAIDLVYYRGKIERGELHRLVVTFKELDDPWTVPFTVP